MRSFGSGKDYNIGIVYSSCEHELLLFLEDFVPEGGPGNVRRYFAATRA